MSISWATLNEDRLLEEAFDLAQRVPEGETRACILALAWRLKSEAEFRESQRAKAATPRIATNYCAKPVDPTHNHALEITLAHQLLGSEGS